MTRSALSHIRDCVLLAASFAMILFVVLMPGEAAGPSAAIAARTPDTTDAIPAARPHDGRFADLAAAGRGELQAAAGTDADR